ncbi:CRISPR-associated protein Cas4 [Lentibacillus cibarius]|uniref:CRISPR-associated exonuclease Cas4 n=1 Tax=Lentibacillus cibarius TaxID=2583219 RepID=A0A549YEF0_9BACI|nr:CRISPR-associated protein Cas4 [Lentibacillus cibarius]TMN21377.1 CRISPR-associated protein Cas4 [Lentibacillus cibarius]TRM10256.1 CRISPR-associated protein Cas4 [Lentibacillus cibarius]
MVSGLHIQYYFVCHRKLWLYAKNIQLEEGHERVQTGKILHERAYKNSEEKELAVDNIKIDAIDGEYVREVKVTSKMTKADKWQLLFYLYELKKRGLNKKGLISYTKEKRTEEVVLTEKDEEELDKIKESIQEIMEQSYPPGVIHSPICTKCAYYDFCYAEEGEE